MEAEDEDQGRGELGAGLVSTKSNCEISTSRRGEVKLRRGAAEAEVSTEAETTEPRLQRLMRSRLQRLRPQRLRLQLRGIWYRQFGGIWYRRPRGVFHWPQSSAAPEASQAADQGDDPRARQ